MDAALYALAGAMLVSALASAIWLRDGPRIESAAPPAPDAARDPRIWRLSAASSLMIIGQIGVTSLLVLYLYSERDWSAAHAALALGGVQVGAAVARVAAGRWSDLRGERVEPFRRLATLAGVLLLAAVVLGPPASMAGGVAAMSWNGLSFTAAARSPAAVRPAKQWAFRTRPCVWWPLVSRSDWARSPALSRGLRSSS